MIEIKYKSSPKNETIYILACENEDFQVSKDLLKYKKGNNGIIFYNDSAQSKEVLPNEICDSFRTDFSYNTEPEKINLDIYKKSSHIPKLKTKQEIIDKTITYQFSLDHVDLVDPEEKTTPLESALLKIKSILK